MSTELWVSADELSDPGNPAAHRSAMAASFLLWALSGRKYGGVRQTTERYECPCRCATRRRPTPGWSGAYPVYHFGAIYNVSGCGGCGEEHRLRLRGRPVHDVMEVSVNGVVMDQDAYEIHDDTYLVPTGTGGTWSLCSTVTVTYTYGTQPPEAGRRSARLLAEQLLLSNINPDECTLPDRVTSVSRQGVTFTILDPQTFLDDGRVGMYEVDAFLRAVNPDKARRPARVLSPDMPRATRVRKPRPAVEPVGPYDLVITRGEDFTRLFLAEELEATFDGAAFTPSGQITMWNGASVLPLDPYFEVAEDDPEGSVRLSIPAELSTAGSLSNGVYDLYAVLEADTDTVVHILSGRVITP